MKILIITPELPWPPETGGKASQFATLKALATDHEFRLVVTRASPLLHDLACQLEQELPHVTVVRQQARTILPSQGGGWKSWLKRGTARLRNALRAREADEGEQQTRKMVPERPYFPFVPLTTESLQLIEGQLGWAELIQAEFHESLYIAFLPIRHIPKIFICHQAHGRFCERFYRSQNLASEPYPSTSAPDSRSLLAATDTSAACVFEASCMSHFTHIVTFTKEDQEALHQQDSSLPISVSPFPIPADCRLVPPEDVMSWDLRLIYVGSSLWYPNVQAVQWFCDKVAPLLREQVDDVGCRLHVVGHWPGPMRQSFCDGNVRFQGYAENISDELTGNISINPVFTGAGLRTKLLASAACNSPIVTTSIGCEGLGLRHGHDCLVADRAEDFAEAILSLMRNQDMAAKLAKRAFEHAQHTFGPEAVRKNRNRMYEQVCRQFEGQS
jgi:glycosyltransferase involved in cell wall biosynthesis